MARAYYIMENNQQKGPFTISELRELGISKDTYIWCEGMHDWKKAGQVFELKTIFESPEFPLPKKETHIHSSDKSIKLKKKRALLFYIFTGLFVVAVIVFIIIQNFNTTNSGGGRDSYQEQVKSIEEIEADSPLQFLYASGTYTENLLGTKFKVKCEITNTATVVSYKDVVIKVTYYTKTKTIIGSDEHTLYEVFKPNSTKTIDLKVSNYSNVATIGWDVVSADVY